MKNKLKSMFNKGRIQVASAAVLGLSTGVVQAQQLVCVPITAQQIFTREHSQENNSCASTSFNYNATYNYNVKMSQQPIDPVGDPMWVQHRSIAKARLVDKMQHRAELVQQPGE